MNKKIYEMLNDVQIDVDESIGGLGAKEKAKIMKRFQAEEKGMKRKNVKRTNIILKSIAGISAAGIAAAAFLFVMGNKADKISTDPNSMTAQVQTTEETAAENSFFLTASAEETASKDTNENQIALREVGGGFPYTGSTFFIRGNNIDKVELSLDKGSLYKGNYKLMQYECSNNYGSEYIGNHYVDDNWNENRCYGLYVYQGTFNEHLESLDDEIQDFKNAYHKSIDDFDGAHLKITVTYKDDSKASEEYVMQTGNVGIYTDPETGTPQPNGKFAGEGEPYFYGIILKKI